MTKAEQIIELLSNRNGFDGWWGMIDEETQEEILNELTELIENLNNNE
jgi:hypothetical protein